MSSASKIASSKKGELNIVRFLRQLSVCFQWLGFLMYGLQFVSTMTAQFFRRMASLMSVYPIDVVLHHPC